LHQKSQKSVDLLVLCQLFYPELISTGQTLTELCEELTKFGVNVEVICGPPTLKDRRRKLHRYIEYKGIKIYRVWGTRFSRLNILGLLINQFTYALSVFFKLLRDKTNRPILVLTNPPFLAFICALLRKFGGKPYIYLIFDVYPDTAINLGLTKNNSLISKLWNFANKFTYKYASKIVVIGRCMNEIIKNKLDRAFDDRIEIIHVWSDDKQIGSTVDKNYFLKKWDIEGKFIILYSGNMGLFHDMETIMTAAKELGNYDDIIFLFVGEGHKKQSIMDYAKKWNLMNCQFHSYVDKELLGSLLSCADVGLVSLKKGQEGLSVPSKTFGIMAAGVPVLAIMSPFSEIARIIKEEKCGVVIEPVDVEELVNVILKFYNNYNELKFMGKNGRNAISKKYNLNSAAKRYYELIKELNY